MPIAYVHLPVQVHYRREAFIDGFARLGYIVRQGQPTEPMRPDDAAIIWNKTSRSRLLIEAAREAGAAVMVAENGYYGKDADGHQPYAIALDGHNGSGRWYAPDDSRLKALDIDFHPFREQVGERVLIAGQRGIGSREMRSPHGFAESMAERLRKMGFRPHIRVHPGTKRPDTTLMEDLEGVRALVVWSSNSATAAQVAGVPTYYAAPTISTAPGAMRFTPAMDGVPSDEDRYAGFSQMAWAQWKLAEIVNGEALRTLLDVHAGKLPFVGRNAGL